MGAYKDISNFFSLGGQKTNLEPLSLCKWTYSFMCVCVCVCVCVCEAFFKRREWEKARAEKWK